ncbi:MAG: glycosyltransferase family 4 protein [Candidatus Aenigmatarchaeota archaeon]
MNILMLGWEFPPFTSGGLGTHCYNITKCLSSKGINISFVIPGYEGEVDSNNVKIIKAGKGKLIKIGVSMVPYLPSVPISFKSQGNEKASRIYGESFFSDIMKFSDSAFEATKNIDCDVIHCHDWMTFLAGMKIRDEKKKPLIVTVHSTEYDRTGSLCPNPWISDIEWQGMSSADRVITVSSYMKKQLIERYSIPEDKIDVVYNSIDSEKYSRDKVSFGLDEKIVLFLGRITLQKGPDYLLKAAKKVLDYNKKVRFIFVGKGDMLPQLIEESINLGISDHVTFTGYQENIEKYYRMADLFVMPSVSEPFGIVVLESMASGIPVITSKMSGVIEVAKHVMSVDFWDVDKMASNIIGALEYDCMRHELSRNGLKEIKSMSWMGSAEKTIDVYNKTINQQINR